MSKPGHDKRTSDAIARLRTAYDTVRKALLLQTHADGGKDPVAATAVAANARLAMAAGGAYLRSRIDPAVPPELADAVRTFAEVLEDIAMNALAGVGNHEPMQAARLRDAETASKRVADLL
ncbi:hypothetical protein [Mycobacterium deserti]|uniref:Uncharacterized protein n=1 Tax=Mycobacterium deserti TaxID=2978347 RepID=A0ABT2ME00_9MYCO|nr:hypothetical protein [Mycobacterium deserti]MCT7660483.1 hypothetical protein [Mycobacterium deserti]